MRDGLPAIVLGIAMLAAFALVLGGLRLLRTPDRFKGVLMLVAAAVIVGNVAIWTT